MNRVILLFIAVFAWNLCFAQSVALVSETDDAIIVDVTINGQKEKKCIETTTPILYETIFFRGIPDSYTCRDGLVGTDESYVKEHQQYFKDMTDGKRFNSFITSSRLINYDKKKNKEAVVRYVVNLRALRLDLENKGVKRRFGF